MKEFVISSREAGQRLDKYLRKLLPEANGGFLYKMLRKKNICLNGVKSDGSDHLKAGDRITLFLSDETFDKFHGKQEQRRVISDCLDIIYEDTDFLFFNKPAGMLSQKAKPSDVSAVEYLTEHLLRNGSLSEEELQTFHPAVCNRLDRNTSGLLSAGKTIGGLQFLTELIRERKIRKFYHCLVYGDFEESRHIKAYLIKDAGTNTVRIEKSGREQELIETIFVPLAHYGQATLLDVELLTGKTHQIRAQLNALGFPILGDPKYCSDRRAKEFSGKLHLKHQLLHSHRMLFPEITGRYERMSGVCMEAPEPILFQRTIQKLS